jgi:hypothetical protein
MGLTRNYDPTTGRDGPTSGALQVISFSFDDVAANETAGHRIDLPTGVGFYVTDVISSADVATGDPKLSVGTTAAGVEVVASISLTTTRIAHTIVDDSNQVGPSTASTAAFLDVVLVADADDAVESASVTVVGYMTSPPASVPDRGPNSPG